MVTGDNIETAKAIAVQCGILKESDLEIEDSEHPICLEGKDFYEMCEGLDV